jgi:hypothetical protein
MGACHAVMIWPCIVCTRGMHESAPLCREKRLVVLATASCSFQWSLWECTRSRDSLAFSLPASLLFWLCRSNYPFAATRCRLQRAQRNRWAGDGSGS